MGIMRKLLNLVTPPDSEIASDLQGRMVTAPVPESPFIKGLAIASAAIATVSLSAAAFLYSPAKNAEGTNNQAQTTPIVVAQNEPVRARKVPKPASLPGYIHD